MHPRRYLARLTPGRRLRTENASLRTQLDRTTAELATERERSTRLRNQRDRARARVGRLAEHRRRDTGLGYVFIVTYGRSGSTLMQGILNSIPGYLVRGENGQLLRCLYDFDRFARAQRQKRRGWLRHHSEYEQLPVTHPFFGIDRYPYGKVRRDLRRLFVDNVLGPEPETRVLGFKEVRWIDPDTPQFIEWIRQTFPGARFVVNTRNLDDVARSGWWGQADDSRQRLENIDSMLRELADDLGEDAFHVHYDEYVADPGTLEGLFTWLGEDFQLERVRQVLEVHHSFVLPIRKDDDLPGTGLPTDAPGAGAQQS